MIDSIGWLATAVFSVSYFFRGRNAILATQIGAASLWTVYGAEVAVRSFFITLAGGVLVGVLVLKRRAADDEHQIASS